jgi:hypothetical protein
VVEYLAARQWDVSVLPIREAHALNGFEFPDDEMTAMMAGLSYVSAVLKG